MNRFPGNKAFAFAIYDDTDLSTVENVVPVYKLLEEIGMRSTKSVWPLATVRDGWHCGASLQEPDYLDFIMHLRDKGFEIALHNVRNHDATREVRRGLRGIPSPDRVLSQDPRESLPQ
jgi:hypothetical protein